MPFVFFSVLCKAQSLFEITRLPTNSNCCFDVEFASLVFSLNTYNYLINLTIEKIKLNLHSKIDLIVLYLSVSYNNLKAALCDLHWLALACVIPADRLSADGYAAHPKTF